MISHHSTDEARSCLTAKIGRDLVFSRWCGRNLKLMKWNKIYSDYFSFFFFLIINIYNLYNYILIKTNFYIKKYNEKIFKVFKYPGHVTYSSQKIYASAQVTWSAPSQKIKYPGHVIRPPHKNFYSWSLFWSLSYS